jgi:hypothetical protein
MVGKEDIALIGGAAVSLVVGTGLMLQALGITGGFYKLHSPVTISRPAVTQTAPVQPGP